MGRHRPKETPNMYMINRANIMNGNCVQRKSAKNYERVEDSIRSESPRRIKKNPRFKE